MDGFRPGAGVTAVTVRGCYSQFLIISSQPPITSSQPLITSSQPLITSSHSSSPQLVLGLITIPLGKLYDCENPLHFLLAALAVGIASVPGYIYGDLNVIGISVVLGTMIAGQVCAGARRHHAPALLPTTEPPRGSTIPVPRTSQATHLPCRHTRPTGRAP